MNVRNHILALKSIVQKATAASSVEHQVRLIVSSVREVLDVDACSLYVKNLEGKLVLRAVDGLSEGAVDSVVLSSGEGITGRISKDQQLVNTSEASAHKDYIYVPATHEERFSGYLGVPLVRLGESIGVLAVQEKESRKFTDEEEAFLTTVAAQLSHIVEVGDFSGHVDESPSDKLIKGIKGAAGIGIGNVLRLDHVDLSLVTDKAVSDTDEEKLIWRDALEQTKIDLEEETESLRVNVSSDVAELMDAYHMILTSDHLSRDVEAAIDAGNWAAGSLSGVINTWRQVFDGMDDPYLRSRGEDVVNIGNKIYQNLLGEKRIVGGGANPVVLMADLVSITEIARYRPGELAGIICNEGSAFSHTAILANALGVPAVMGLGGGERIEEGDYVIVDGNRGEVVLYPSEALSAGYRKIIESESELMTELAHLKDECAVTQDGFKVSLYANTGLMADIAQGSIHGAEGVGLFRTEMPFIASDTFPTEDEQYEVYRHALEVYKGKPVSIRTLDVGGDKPLSYYPFSEENPFLGWRGIRFTLDNASIFMTQIRAMLRASEGLNNLQVLLPMVSSVQEVDTFLEMLNMSITQLIGKGLKIERPDVGIMIEIPGVVELLPFLVNKIDFVSIGSNDLTQYLLAVDRGNSRVADMFDPLHPAVIHTLWRTVQRAKELGLHVSLCGEMGADPHAALLLVGMGVDSLSMSAYNLPKIKWLIRSIYRDKAHKTLEQVLQMSSTDEIKTTLVTALEEISQGHGEKRASSAAS